MTLSSKFNLNREKKIDIIIYLLLFFLFFALVFPTLSHPSWESLDNWRQSDTYSVGMDFRDNGVDLLNPRFSYYGPHPKKIQLELMVLPALGVLFSKFTGFSPTVFRVISSVAFILSAIFLYKLSIERANRRVALISSILYILMPFSQFYGRSIQPESMALLGYIGAFYFLSRFDSDESFRNLLLSALFLAFALLEKLSLGFVGIVPVFVLIRKYKKEFLLKKEFWIYGIISLVIPLIYYYVVGIGATDPFVRQIYGMVSDSSRYDFLDTLRFIYETSILGFSPIMAVLGLFGLFYFIYKKDSFMIVWYISLILSMGTLLSGIRLKYYMIFWLPLISLSAAVLIDKIDIEAIKLSAMAVVICLTFFNGQNFLIDNSKIDPYLDSVILAMDEHIPDGSFVAINGENPAPLSATSHLGYRLPLSDSDKPIKLMQAMDEGLEYYVFLKYNNLDDRFFRLVESNSDLVYQNLEVAIFKFNKD